MMDLASFQQFIDLAKTRHFARTAGMHHVSPSTLSRSMQRLEERVGFALLERNNRSVKLTAAGERFLAFASETLSHWQALKRELEESAESVSGEVSLYCSVTASHSLLNVILADLRDAQPGIDIKLHTGDQAMSLQRLQRGEDDLVIAARPDSLPDSVEFKQLSRSRLVFIAPRQACFTRELLDRYSGQRQSIPWQELPWILAERGITRARLQSWFKSRGISPHIYAQVTGHEAIASMVALGCGIGVVPELVLTSSPVRDSIELVELDEGLADFEIGLCVNRADLKKPVIDAVWRNISSRH